MLVKSELFRVLEDFHWKSELSQMDLSNRTEIVNLHSDESKSFSSQITRCLRPAETVMENHCGASTQGSRQHLRRGFHVCFLQADQPALVFSPSIW